MKIMEEILNNLRKEMTKLFVIKSLTIFFVAKLNKEITTTELRELELIHPSKFTTFLKNTIADVEKELNKKGYNLIKKTTKYGGTSYICKLL